jgi:type I restriction enzyme R subunit
VRLYAFLSQMIDYGNTDIEKRFFFYKRLIPLLDFGRERETVDLSKVVLTHHTLRSAGRLPLNLKDGQGNYKLSPLDAVGSGAVQDKQKALLVEIIDRVNGLFEGQLTDGDKLSYVNGVKEKLLENQTLIQQSSSNSRDQFGNSPDLRGAFDEAVMDSHEAHSIIAAQVLKSASARAALLEILLGPGQLYEALRAKAGQPVARI